MNWTEKQLEQHLRKFGLPGAERNTADTSEPPFAAPADIVLDLPPPLSVNKLRRINWSAMKRADAWRKVANGHLMEAKQRKTVRFDRIERFEITVTLDEKRVFIDLDNTLKLLIDYIRHVNIIKDDAPQNMRGLHVVWGEAPLGTRVTVRPCT